MGKYMRRKTKTTGEPSLMDVPSLGGVRTRAKTLALKQAAAAVASAGAASYIQLRSRRLVKPTSPKREKEISVPTNPNKPRRANSSTLKVNCVDSCGSVNELVDKEEKIHQEAEIKGAVNLGIDEEEASFGENMMESEGRERSPRETTPSSFIRDPDVIRTPGSSTKPTHSTEGSCRAQNTTPRHIPSTLEMDEFFTGPEKQQQRQFIEKYNFDPVNEKPLLGRYQWVKVDDTKNVD